MAVEDDETLATFFDVDDFAVAATFTPASGPPVGVTVVLDEPQEIHGLGLAGVAQANRRVILRSGEVADPTGGSITISGTTFRVVEPEKDITGKIWTFGLKP